jgi:hypothetical protein
VGATPVVRHKKSAGGTTASRHLNITAANPATDQIILLSLATLLATALLAALAWLLLAALARLLLLLAWLLPAAALLPTLLAALLLLTGLLIVLVRILVRHACHSLRVVVPLSASTPSPR